jgi:hypothetical protein
VTPSPEIAAIVDAASRGWTGEEVEVAGVVRRSAASAAGGSPDHEVVFWEYAGPDTGETRDEVRTMSVRDVVERAAVLAGETVRVIGNFRGRNLHGDLDGPGPRGAWVLKAKRHAVWVTGHGPSGRGFRLDPRLVEATTRWLEVVGTVETREGRAVLRARRVALAAPTAFVWNGPRLRMSDPRPAVVFTLPVAGEEVPAHDARLLVQFSAYMDEESFAGRVRVRCGGPGEEPTRDAPRARWSYDAVRRALLVDPGEPLQPGGAVEVQFLHGIEDVHGAPLEAAGEATASPVRALRWRVASGSASLRATP